MNTNRKPFTPTTKKTVLIDLNGQRVRCNFHGCTCDAQHIHHETYVSQGGTNELVNLTAMCSKHHIQLHSTRGDFSQWGKQGGTKTAASGKSLKNLPQYQGVEGAKRLAIKLAQLEAQK